MDGHAAAGAYRTDILIDREATRRILRTPGQHHRLAGTNRFRPGFERHDPRLETRLGSASPLRGNATPGDKHGKRDRQYSVHHLMACINWTSTKSRVRSNREFAGRDIGAASPDLGRTYH